MDATGHGLFIPRISRNGTDATRITRVSAAGSVPSHAMRGSSSGRPATAGSRTRLPRFGWVRRATRTLHARRDGRRCHRRRRDPPVVAHRRRLHAARREPDRPRRGAWQSPTPTTRSSTRSPLAVSTSRSRSSSRSSASTSTSSTAFEHFDALAGHAAERGSWAWIDMEGSAYTESTIEFYERARARHENVGICLQAYLHRTPADIQRLLPTKPAIRLVKGAYDEPKADRLSLSAGGRRRPSWPSRRSSSRPSRDDRAGSWRRPTTSRSSSA